MRKSTANKRLWAKVIIALVFSIFVFTIAAVNSDAIVGLFTPEQPSSTLPPSTIDYGNDIIETKPPLQLASTLDDGAGIKAGTGTAGAGYPMNYADISAGKFHALVVDLDGFVYSRGSNEFLQLGLGAGTAGHSDNTTGKYFDYLQPVVALNNYFMTKVSAGGYHSMAIGYDPAKGGTSINANNYVVFTWGRQNNGRLGNAVSTATNTGVPQNITARLTSLFSTGEYPTAISAGEHHSMLLTNLGNLYTWGCNGNGQLGRGNTTDSNIPVKISLPSGRYYNQISAGSVHSLALANTTVGASNGYLYAWGSNERMQAAGTLNVNVTSPTARFTSNLFTQISAGELHNLAMNNATLYAWGDQGGGKCGDGQGHGARLETSIQRNSLHTVTGATWKANSASAGIGSYVIANDNRLWAFGTGADTYYGTGNANTTAARASAYTSIAHTDKTIFVGTNNVIYNVGYLARYSDMWYGKASPPMSDNLIDTAPKATTYEVKNTNGVNSRFTPYRNIIGLPVDISTNRETNSQNVKAHDEIIFNVDRVKLTAFSDNGASDFAVAQVTQAVYIATTKASSGASFGTNSGAKSYVLSREGYYVAKYRENTTVVYRKFQISNKTGPEISVETPANDIYAYVKIYDGFGLKSLAVTGSAMSPGGGTESYNGTATYANTVYNAVFTVPRNSVTNFTITAIDALNTTSTQTANINNVVYLASTGITKDYDGRQAVIDPLFYSKARGEFNLTTFNNNYGSNGFSVSAMQYFQGGSSLGTTAPINAASNYTASYGILKTGQTPPQTTLNIVINKATPIITASTQAITYGQHRNSFGLTGTVVNKDNSALTYPSQIGGTFAYPAGLPEYPNVVDHTRTYSITFTPDAATGANYNPATIQSIQFTVNKATPVLSNLSSAAINYEQPVTNATISGTTANAYNAAFPVPGTWNWRTGDFPAGFNTSRPEVYDSTSRSGGTLYPIRFIPSDINNYNMADGNAPLTINPIDQTITFTPLTSGNSDVRVESLRQDLADFEVSVTAGAITLTVYTTAIYPSARQVRLSVSNVNMATLSEPTTIEVVETDQGLRSKTEYILTFNPNITDFSYGILALTADQYDNNRPTTPTQSGHRGNYNAADEVVYRLYIKREHTANVASFADIQKIYGDSSFTIEPALNSGRSDFSLTSSNNNILSLSQEPTNMREAAIVNTGEVTLTLSHPGYVDPNTAHRAYVAMSDSITVTITPTPLVVGLKDIQVYYGNSTPQFEYTFDGLVYNEDPSVVLRSLTTANNTDYVFANMKDVKREAGDTLGYYTVTPRNVQNASVAYLNYSITTYTSAKLTVMPRTVVATIADLEKLYGDVNPTFTISYSDDFVLGETIATEGIIRPTVDDSEVVRFSVLGDYLIYLEDGYANNYNFDVDDTATLTVKARPVTITFPAIIREYTGISVSPSLTDGDVVITGLENEFPDEALRPVHQSNVNAVKFAYSIDNIIWTTDQPVNAGQFHVRVTYEAASYDNYATTSTVFERRITINPTNPRLALAAVSTNYSASPISVTANALAVEYGIAPAGSLSYAYAGADGEFLSTPPRNAGIYSVRVTYVPATADNYKSYNQTFTDILEINKVNVSLLLPVRETTYTSTDGLSADRVASAQAEVYGKGDDQPETAGRFAYEYYIDGHWGNNRPYNAGRYHVRVTYTAQETENYLTTTVVFDERVIIREAEIANNISLTVKTVDYSGSPVSANEAMITGIPGGSKPEGRITYEYQLGSGNFETEPFRNANRYNVRVRYTSVVGDNYKSTERFFEHAVIINRISPTISLPEYRYEFDGRVRSVTGASVTGIQGGSVPSGAVSYRYLVNGNWSSVGPRNANPTPYSVQVVYEPSADDNYSQEVKLFERGIFISQAKPELFLATQAYDYTGSNIMASGGRVMGKPNDDEGPIGDPTYQYYIDNIWTSDFFPINSGSYNVKMIFTAEEGTNYTSIEKIFSNVLIIRNIAPQFEVDRRSYDYDGESHTIPEPKITNGNQEPLGTWTFEYYLGSNRWTSKAPADAGSYDVRVRYNEAQADNYSSKTETVSDALVILPLDIYVTPQSNQSKVYDGYPVAEGTITFNEIELIPGNEWRGSLRAGNSAASGDYLITRGSLSAGNNYRLIVSESVVYTITPKEIQIKFSTIYPEYNGVPKTPEITVDESSLIPGDAVSIYTRYEGDNLNVGEFVAVAIMSERNYILPNPRSMQYSIVPARMTENIFESYSVPYNKESHPITLSAIASGATVVYDSPTEYTSRGVYTVKATVSKPNYHDDILSATLTITRGTHLNNLIVFPPEHALYYGDPIPKITSSVSEGQISLDEGQQLLTGTHDYAWTFVPADIENFDILHGTIRLTVNKSKSIVDLQGALTQYLDAPQSITATITDTGGQLLTNSPSIFFTSADGEVFEYLPTKSGRYTLNIVYSGNENFDSASYTTVLVIKEKVNLVWVWLSVGAVTLLVVASALYFKHRNKRKIG